MITELFTRIALPAIALGALWVALKTLIQWLL